MNSTLVWIKDFLFKPPEDPIGNYLVGVSLLAEGMAVCLVAGRTKKDLELIAYKIIKSNDPGIWQQQLQDFVNKYNIVAAPCCVVPMVNKYHLEFVEKPKVKDTELSDAVRWSLKEFIEYPIERASVSILDVPMVRSLDNSQMIIAALMDQQEIAPIAETIMLSGLELRYIEIQESCLRNAVGISTLVKGISLVLNIFPDHGNFIVLQNNDILIYRNISLDLTAYVLEQDLGYIGSSNDDDLENLSLEVQRTIDQASTLFRGCVVENVLIMPSNLDLLVIVSYLEKALSVPLCKVDLNKIMPRGLKIVEEEQAQVTLALGAALHTFEFEAPENAES